MPEATTSRGLLEQDIIPKSERTLELSIEEYSSGKTDYEKVINHWRSLLKFRSTKLNILSKRMQQQASLARRVGQLEPIPSASFLQGGDTLTVAEELDFEPRTVELTPPAE